MIKRIFDDEIGSNNLNLTSKEFICLLLYGSGYTARQIAEMLNKSSKTIVFHIENVKHKINCKDKQSMNAYIREHGWDYLLNFFSLTFRVAKNSKVFTLLNFVFQYGSYQILPQYH